jgi:hypothetical protein
MPPPPPPILWASRVMGKRIVAVLMSRTVPICLKLNLALIIVDFLM